MRYFLRVLLQPVAILYRMVMWTRNFFFDRGWLKVYQADVPVISIGNLSMGGTGKTPMAEYVLATLLKRGLRPAYVSRGYGRNTKGFQQVLPGKSVAMSVGDEALQIAHKFPSVPVAVSEVRAAGIQMLAAQAPFDCVVIDDGFQHRSLHRDLNIVLIDANRPPWRDDIFPAGRLREPSSSLKRADFVVVNKLHDWHLIPRWQRKLQADTGYAQLSPARMVPFGNGRIITEDKAKEDIFVVAFSAVASNGSFFRDLKRLGYRVKHTFGFRDHHVFTARELQKITKVYRDLAAVKYLAHEPILVTTEKDYFRLKDEPWFATMASQYPFYYLEVQLAFWDSVEILEQKIAALFANGHTKAALNEFQTSPRTGTL